LTRLGKLSIAVTIPRDLVVELGWRRNKKGAGWVKASEKEIGADAVHQRLWYEEHDRLYEILSETEKLRLRKLAAAENAPLELDETYEIVASSNGLIYISLQANPFEPSPECLGARLKKPRSRCPGTKGFSIEAKNLLLECGRMVYIKATRFDDSFIECLWPNTVPLGRVHDLADDLTSRVQGESGR